MEKTGVGFFPDLSFPFQLSNFPTLLRADCSRVMLVFKLTF